VLLLQQPVYTVGEQGVDGVSPCPSSVCFVCPLHHFAHPSLLLYHRGEEAAEMFDCAAPSQVKTLPTMPDLSYDHGGRSNIIDYLLLVLPML
jgi:hypothetical protein